MAPRGWLAGARKPLARATPADFFPDPDEGLAYLGARVRADRMPAHQLRLRAPAGGSRVSLWAVGSGPG